MTSQLFKVAVPVDILITFLKSCTDGRYIISNDTYKRALSNGSIDAFLNNLKDYYFPSKQYYVTRKMSHKNFNTVIRQICNHSKIQYSSKVVYDKSSYSIIYYIDISTNIIADQQFPHNGIAF